MGPRPSRLCFLVPATISFALRTRCHSYQGTESMYHDIPCMCRVLLLLAGAGCGINRVKVQRIKDSKISK